MDFANMSRDDLLAFAQRVSQIAPRAARRAAAAPAAAPAAPAAPAPVAAAPEAAVPAGLPVEETSLDRRRFAKPVDAYHALWARPGVRGKGKPQLVDMVRRRRDFIQRNSSTSMAPALLIDEFRVPAIRTMKSMLKDCSQAKISFGLWFLFSEKEKPSAPPADGAEDADGQAPSSVVYYRYRHVTSQATPSAVLSGAGDDELGRVFKSLTSAGGARYKSAKTMEEAYGLFEYQLGVEGNTGNGSYLFSLAGIEVTMDVIAQASGKWIPKPEGAVGVHVADTENDDFGCVFYALAQKHVHSDYLEYCRSRRKDGELPRYPYRCGWTKYIMSRLADEGFAAVTGLQDPDDLWSKRADTPVSLGYIERLAELNGIRVVLYSACGSPYAAFGPRDTPEDATYHLAVWHQDESFSDISGTDHIVPVIDLPRFVKRGVETEDSARCLKCLQVFPTRPRKKTMTCMFCRHCDFCAWASEPYHDTSSTFASHVCVPPEEPRRAPEIVFPPSGENSHAFGGRRDFSAIDLRPFWGTRDAEADTVTDLRSHHIPLTCSTQINYSYPIPEGTRREKIAAWLLEHDIVLGEPRDFIGLDCIDQRRNYELRVGKAIQDELRRGSTSLFYTPPTRYVCEDGRVIGHDEFRRTVPKERCCLCWDPFTKEELVPLSDTFLVAQPARTKLSDDRKTVTGSGTFQAASALRKAGCVWDPQAKSWTLPEGKIFTTGAVPEKQEEPTPRIIEEHCHGDGTINGWAHHACNVLKVKKGLVIYGWNSNRYDDRFDIASLLKTSRASITDQLLESDEGQCLFFTVNGCVEYRDGMRIVGGSLDKNVSALTDGASDEVLGERLPYTLAWLERMAERGHGRGLATARLALAKGTYFYFYLTPKTVKPGAPFPSFDDLWGAYEALPSERQVTFKAPNLEDYEKARRFADAFNLRTWREYTLFYNNLDVVQTSDVLAARRRTFMSEAGVRLDLFGYLTSSSFALSVFMFNQNAATANVRTAKPKTWSIPAPPEKKPPAVVCETRHCPGIGTVPPYAYPPRLDRTRLEIPGLSGVIGAWIYRAITRYQTGGLSTCTGERHVVANDPRLEGFSPERDPCYINYEDINSLYGTAQTMLMPAGDYHHTRWEGRRMIPTLEGVSELPPENYVASGRRLERGADNGYSSLVALLEKECPDAVAPGRGAMLCLDFAFPAECHDWLRDITILPGRVHATLDELSPSQQKLLLEEAALEAAASGREVAPEVLRARVSKALSSGEKLRADLLPKTVMVDLGYAKFVTEQGVVISGVREVISYRAERLMGPFLDKFHNLRKGYKAAGDDPGSAAMKGCITASFGKTCEGMSRKMREVGLYRMGSHEYRRKLRCSSFISSTPIPGTDYASVVSVPHEVTYDKLGIQGAWILMMSKQIVNRAIFAVFAACGRVREDKSTYERARVLYQDTDSMVMRSSVCPIQASLAHPAARAIMDYKNCQGLQVELTEEDRAGFDELGRFKLEDDVAAGGVPIGEFIGLGPKCYMLRYAPERMLPAAFAPGFADYAYFKWEQSRKPRMVTRRNGPGDYVQVPATKSSELVLHCKGIPTSCLEASHFEAAVASKKKVQYSYPQWIRTMSGVRVTMGERNGLVAVDSKRWLCEDGIQTLPIGHYAAAA